MNTHSSVETLREALAEVMQWIKGWDPNFIHDDEWPATAAKVKAILDSSTAVSETNTFSLNAHFEGPRHRALSRAVSRLTDAIMAACGMTYDDENLDLSADGLCKKLTETIESFSRERDTLKAYLKNCEDNKAALANECIELEKLQDHD